MPKKKESRQKKINVRVDFTPMVDMMMLLITFFMLCTTLAKPQTMELSMPTNDKNLSDQDISMEDDSNAVATVLLDNVYMMDTLGTKAHLYKDVKKRLKLKLTDVGWRVISIEED